MYKKSNDINLFQKKTKDELLFDSYKRKVQKGGNYKEISEYQYLLASCYMNGVGIAINHHKAIHYLKISSHKGNMKSQYYLSIYYDEGIYIEKNINEAIKWCKKSAEQNYDLAQNQMGCYYEIGNDIDKNIEEAINLYKKAAAQNNISAQYNLASCYEYGRGIEGKNMSEAFKWYKKSADQDYHRAQNKLGWFYENGLGTEKNITKAVKWYRKSSKQDNCKAQYNLGKCYKYNKGIEKHDINLKIAFRLYNRAIEQGCKCEDTVYEYALCYENGEGVEKDIKKAFKLYKQAAELDYPIACYKVSELYRNGKGIKINLEKSIKWCEKARKLGYFSQEKTNTIKIIDKINNDMDMDMDIDMDIDNGSDTVSDSTSDNDNDNVNDNDNDNVNDNYNDNDNEIYNGFDNMSDCNECDGCYECNECNECYECNEFNDCRSNTNTNTNDEIQNIDKNVWDIKMVQFQKNMELFNKEELQKHLIKCKFDNEEIQNRMSKFDFYNNRIEKALKLQKIDAQKIVNNKLNIEKYNKDLLDYYTKKLDIILKYYLDNNIYYNTYTNSGSDSNSDSEINYVNKLYIRYNYNCGVIHHELGNYEEAITYYEEAAYHKYSLAQKALSYCYKHGIYYVQSIEKAEKWYNLYINNKEKDLEKCKSNTSTSFIKSELQTHLNILDIEDVN